jgi:hypothetical protein
MAACTRYRACGHFCAVLVLTGEDKDRPAGENVLPGAVPVLDDVPSLLGPGAQTGTREAGAGEDGADHPAGFPGGLADGVFVPPRA